MFVKDPKTNALRWRNKVFDSYNGGEQPGGKGNEAATPQETNSEESKLMKEHGGSPHRVVIDSDHRSGVHKVSAHFPDGHEEETMHLDGTAARKQAERLEEGGDAAWKDTKKSEHKPQQSSSSEEKNFEAPSWA